jgi:eukaryotic-like serine/threonine-protein kinase
VDSAGGRPDRPLRGYAVAAVVVLVLAVAGVAYALTRADRPADPSSATRGTSSSSSPPGDSPSSSASRPPSSSAGRSSSATGSPRATGSPTPSAKQPSPASFLRGYFAVAPGGTDRGWAQLGPHERAQGRAAYDRFWRGIASVEVRDIVPVAGTDSVELTVTYHETNGQVSTERQRLDLLRSPSGGYLIDNDDVIG